MPRKFVDIVDDVDFVLLDPKEGAHERQRHAQKEEHRHDGQHCAERDR